jgi:hypothetical protein
VTGTADPWEPPCAPAFLWKTQRTPSVERTPAPERVYDADAAKEPMPPRGPLGFTAAAPQSPEAAAIARALAVCDEWDALSKGETSTTGRIRAALTLNPSPASLDVSPQPSSAYVGTVDDVDPAGRGATGAGEAPA